MLNRLVTLPIRSLSSSSRSFSSTTRRCSVDFVLGSSWSAAGASKGTYEDSKSPNFPNLYASKELEITPARALTYIRQDRAVIRPYRQDARDFLPKLHDEVEALIKHEDWFHMSYSERLLRAWVKYGPAGMYAMCDKEHFLRTFSLGSKDARTMKDAARAEPQARGMYLVMVPKAYADVYGVVAIDDNETPYLDSSAFMNLAMRRQTNGPGWSTAVEKAEKEQRQMCMWSIKSKWNPACQSSDDESGCEYDSDYDYGIVTDPESDSESDSDAEGKAEVMLWE